MMKKINRSAVFFSLLFLSASALRAQTEDVILMQLSQSSQQPSLLNGVELQQNGTKNEAFIIQATNEGSGGVKAVQAGSDNTIELMQSGNYIDIEISQHGNGNVYEADIEGEGSRIEVSQSGYENFIFQSLISNHSDIAIRQNGNQNEVIHTGTPTNSGIQVRQQGTGMKVIIQTN